MMRLFFGSALLVCTPAFAAPTASALNSTAPLRQFLAHKEDFQWKPLGRDGNRFLLQMTSGKWKNTLWRHQIAVYEPRQNRHPDAATLFLATGAAPTDKIAGQLAADATGARFVVVNDVPNQPLWNRSENDLLGYGVQKSLETGDPSWSLAFPMARSATRAMDVVSRWSQFQKNPVKRWILLGFSKRALACWLAAPDARVAGLVSVGYNNLNLEAQAKLQKRDWGALSTHWQKMVPLADQKQLEKPRGAQLLATWDPWSFRDQISAPKLLVDSTNNDYWTLDSLDAFDSELRGPTSTLYFANAGHFMENSMLGLFQSCAAWIDTTLAKKAAPTIEIGFAKGQLVMNATGAPQRRIRYAWSQTRDFRQANWQDIAVPDSRGARAFFALPKLPLQAKHAAFFAEGSWQNPLPKSELPLHLTSKIFVLRRQKNGAWTP